MSRIKSKRGKEKLHIVGQDSNKKNHKKYARKLSIPINSLMPSSYTSTKRAELREFENQILKANK